MLTLILGGARSGKSRLAQRLASATTDVTYVATYREGHDPEMRERVERHRASRPAAWRTIEEPIAIADAVEAVAGHGLVIVDCLTIWLSNLFWEHRDGPTRDVEEIVSAQLERIAAAARGCRVILVSNEVGSGTVPDHRVSRAFRDVHGWLNQKAAAAADEVILAVAGLPLYLKTASAAEVGR